MKFPFAPKKKRKMNAATATATAGGGRRPRETEYMDEPNVSLVSAAWVVLVLHLVLVGGIIAFSSIKTHQDPAFEEPPLPQHPAAPAVADADSPPVSETAAATPAPSIPAMKIYRVRSGDNLVRVAAANLVTVSDLQAANNLHAGAILHVGQELKIPAATLHRPAEVAAKSSGSTYTVLKGETTVAIARKLHVNYDDLLKLNKIDDPKKLRIGQKLKVPAKRIASN